MELRVIRYFLTVAYEGNITKAAELLHITQPTLSRQLMQLEEDLGVILFERGKRQVVLTDEGVLFHLRAKEIVSLVDKTKREFAGQQYAVGGTVFLGSVEASAALVLPELLKNFSQKYPLVQYDLYSGYSDDIKEKMDKGLIDVGLLVDPVETSRYDYIRLPRKERWGILLRKDDPLAEKSSLTLDEIKHSPLFTPRRALIQNELARWLGEEYKKLRIFATYNLLSNISLLVEQGMGYAICLQGAFYSRENSNTLFVPLEPAHISGSLLVWRKNQIFSTTTGLFIKHCQECLEQQEL